MVSPRGERGREGQRWRTLVALCALATLVAACTSEKPPPGKGELGASNTPIGGQEPVGGALPGPGLPGPSAGMPDTAFIPDDYSVALVVHPKSMIESELVKALPAEQVESQIRNMGPQMEQAKSLEEVIVAFRIPEDLTSMMPGAGMPPPDIAVPESTLQVPEAKGPVPPPSADIPKAPEAPKDEQGCQPGGESPGAEPGHPDGSPAPAAPPGRPRIHAVVQMRFSDMAGRDNLMKSAMTKSTEAESHGRKYLKFMDGSAGFLVGDTILQVVSPDATESYLAFKPSTTVSPLRTQLGKRDINADFVLAFSLDKADKQIEQATQMAGMLPVPGLQHLLELPKKIEAGCIQMSVSGGSLLKAHLTLRTEDAAKELETMTSGGLKQLQEQKKMFAQGAPPDAQPFLPLAEKLIDGLSVKRTGRELTINAPLPGTWTEIVAAMQPAIEKARKAGANAHRMNNLRQVGLAMHNYHDTFRSLPVPRSNKDAFDAEGKPLHGWRSHVLPFLESAPVDVTKPWDDDANKGRAGEAPLMLQASPTDKGKTRIVVLTGPGTLFPPDKALSFSGVTDGLSMTIMAIELPEDKAIPWTSRDDIVFNPEDPLAGIGPIPAEGLQVLLGDGVVRTLKADIKPEDFKALVTPAGNEIISSDLLN